MENNPEAKVALFDRIFKPKTVTIPNGHTVSKPASRMPMILIILGIVFVASIYMTGFDISIIIKRGHQLTVILAKIFNPKFSYFSKVVGNGIGLFNRVAVCNLSFKQYQ